MEDMYKKIFAYLLLVTMLYFAPLAQSSDYIRDGKILKPGSAKESLIFDPETENWVLTYKTYYNDGSDMLYRIVFVPATKIDPTVKSKIKVTKTGTFRYLYEIRNGKKSEQLLNSAMVLVPEAIETNVNAPKGWIGSANKIIGYLGDNTRKTGFLGINVAWHPWRKISPRTAGGITPGKELKGFTYESRHLPGINVLKLEGYVAKIMGFAGEGPHGPVGDEFDKLRKNDFVPVFVAAPKIPVPVPFNAAEVLENTQKYVQELVTMKLMSKDFAAKLDTEFTAAINASQQGNVKLTRRHIQNLRHLLKREHKDLDDSNKNKDSNKEDEKSGKEDKKKKWKTVSRLAARVLDFTLKYVEKRIKGPLE